MSVIGLSDLSDRPEEFSICEFEVVPSVYASSTEAADVLDKGEFIVVSEKDTY